MKEMTTTENSVIGCTGQDVFSEGKCYNSLTGPGPRPGTGTGRRAEHSAQHGALPLLYITSTVLPPPRAAFLCGVAPFLLWFTFACVTLTSLHTN